MRSKTTKTRILVIAVACLLVAGLGTTATLARQFGPGHGRHDGPPDPERMIERMADQLDLSPQQQEQLQALLESRHEGMENKREQIRTAREALKEAVTAETFDEAAVRQASAAVAALQAEHAVERASFLQQVRGVLSAEQMAEFEEMHQRRQERRDRRRGGGPGRHGHGPRGF